MMSFENPTPAPLPFFWMLYLDLEIPITIRKLVWGLIIHYVLGSNCVLEGF
jgi:hypothetical protein